VHCRIFVCMLFVCMVFVCMLFVYMCMHLSCACMFPLYETVKKAPIICGCNVEVQGSNLALCTYSTKSYV
jgi:hypothetical protein